MMRLYYTTTAIRAALHAFYCGVTMKCQFIPAQTHGTGANSAFLNLFYNNHLTILEPRQNLEPICVLTQILAYGAVRI